MLTNRLFMLMMICLLGTMQLFSADSLLDTKLLKEKSLVQAKLLEKPNQLVLAVDGMCCSNCAVSIGKKIADVKSVDTDNLSKGITVDRENGLLTVALKKGVKVDYKNLYDAIRKAGYSPVRLYTLNSDHTVSLTHI